MRLVDIDELKKEYKKALNNNLIDKNREIDLSEHAQIPCDYFDKFIDDLPVTDVLNKIKGYVDHIRNTGMGKKKSLEFIEKFIEGLKTESEDNG